MDLIDHVRQLASRMNTLREHILTEESTKTALVLPMIQALGYDVFNPGELLPEFTADIAGKKGEKVDYAILRDGKPIILIECKKLGDPLAPDTAYQLCRYFQSTDVGVGVLTNGVVYRFFSNLDNQRRMDDAPYFEFCLDRHKPKDVEELKKYSKDIFDFDNITGVAREMKYSDAIKRILHEELDKPSEEFVRFFASTKKVYSGHVTQNVLNPFFDITKKAFQHFVQDKIDERMEKAKALDEKGQTANPSNGQDGAGVAPVVSSVPTIETTREEWEAFYIVKAIVRKIVSADRVALHPKPNYCSARLDDTNRKRICRFYFKSGDKTVGIFDEMKTETKYPLPELDNLFAYSDKIRAVVEHYERLKAGPKTEPEPVPTA